MEYVIGVDIGASKSHLSLFNTEGTFVSLNHWGPLNHEVLPGSYTQFEAEFGKLLMQTLSANAIKIDQIKYSVLGVAGVDTRKQHSIISGIINKLGLKHFTVCNDAYLGIPAGSRTGIGICAINGSGCTLAGINKKREMLQIGGVGDISADKGGGGYIGAQLVAAVYTELFRKGEPTFMTPLLLEKLGITNKYDFVEKIYQKSENGTFSMHTCAPLVFEAVKKQDRIAAGILQQTAINYAGGISCMIEEMEFPLEDELYIVLAGSVFVKGENPFLIDALKAKIDNDNPGRNIQYKLLDVPNVAGAAIWALNTFTGACDYYDKVCAQLYNML